MDGNIEAVSKYQITFGKIVFRFFYIYLVLFILPFPFTSDFSWGTPIAYPYYHFWGQITQWFSSYFLNLKVKAEEGEWAYDTIFSYVQTLAIAIVSAIICIFWFIIEKRNKTSQIIFYWAHIYFRYFLVYNMVSYGFGKIYNLQFAWARFPKLVDLVAPYGYQTPTVLFWRFMAYSNSYQIFTGSIEILAGVLLLFRRTIVLGVIITIAAMANVAMMNWSYNIQVKNLSMHLLLIAIFLLIPYIKRVIDFFVLNKATPPVQFLPDFIGRKMNIAIRVFQVALLFPSLWYIYFSSNVRFIKHYGHEPEPPLWGIYRTEGFIMNKDTLPPLATDSVRWKQLIVDRQETNIYLMNENIDYCRTYIDTIKRVIIITSDKDSLDRYFLSYSIPMKDQLMLEGKHKNDSLHIRMKKVDIKDFQLVRAKSHWIWKAD